MYVIMKALSIKTVISALVFISAGSLMAVVMYAFSSWDFLTETSPDIVIARCSRTPDPYRDHGSGPTGSLFDTDIEVVSILKSATNWGTEVLDAPPKGSSRLSSAFYPRQGEYYLIFSVFYDHEYQANESYRVVPLGLTINTNALTGKTLEEQIMMLLQKRLNSLNLEIKQGQEEKERLEQAFRK